MSKSKVVEHIITLRIRPDDIERPMTEKQTKRWIESVFKGDALRQYGAVRVTNVINEEVKEN